MTHLSPEHPLSPENDYAADETALLEYRNVCIRAIRSMRANTSLLEGLNTIDGRALAAQVEGLVDDLEGQLFDQGVCTYESKAPANILPDYVEFLIESGRHPRFAAE